MRTYQMPDPTLPGETRAFIARHIRSVEELEILLLLHAQPERSWSSRAVYDVILSSQQSVAMRLETLAKAGLARAEAGEPVTYRYAAPPEVAAQVDALAGLYKLKPVRVIEAIFTKGPDPVQSFADAFRLSPPPQP